MHRQHNPRPDERMQWMDALRAIAAGTVVVFHLVSYGFPALRPLWLVRQIDLGRYGVMLFFLVSGYVIAMALERYRHLGAFWIGRVFRLYPAYLVSALAMAAVLMTGYRPYRAYDLGDPAISAISHAAMLGEFTGASPLVGVYWTLSYEMVFYLVVSALFVFGLQRRAHWWALGLAGVALLLGGVLPGALIGVADSHRLIAASALLLLLAGSIAAYVWGGRRAWVGAGLGGLALLGYVALNGRLWERTQAIASWNVLTLLAIMFAGSVVFYAHRGVLRRPVAFAVLAAVLVEIVAATWVHLADQPWAAHRLASMRQNALVTLLAVVITFAAVFMLRNRRFPRALIWLGRVSYSTYLFHNVVLFALLSAIRPARMSWPAQAVLFVATLIAILVVSELSYRLVERPGQALAKRLSRRFRADEPQPGPRPPVPSQRTEPDPVAEPAAAR
ncbi:acyltransferase family protein [Catellatospora vulcania]|uniref:acyltransferase family protein n=1 Tax=Catellatospora vulcania TaxID=1460450 RepID=UPI0012D49665|nr:acyltransferase [Catellatospora vulcania]